VGKTKIIGIGAGVGIGAIIALFVVYSTMESDDARLAEIIATYFDDTDRLAVALMLHDADGEFTKANGHIELTIKSGASTVYSNEYDFTKNDFVTWDNPFLGKQRGVPIVINEMFPSGDYDVYVNLETKSSYWESLHASFYSLESDQQETMKDIPEPPLHGDPEPVERFVEEPVQQQVPAPGFEDVPEMIVESENRCDSSYPTVCIEPWPPDLDCGEIQHTNFKVLPDDPHGFDGDKDGIGCES